jgi:hypothetical protein
VNDTNSTACAWVDGNLIASADISTITNADTIIVGSVPNLAMGTMYVDNFSFWDDAGQLNATAPAPSNEEQCYYNVTGLDTNNRITFGTGEAGDSLYSNATGNWGDGAMMNITISTNASVKVHDLFLDYAEADLHSTVHWENISIACSTDNSSWGDFKQLTSIDNNSDLSNVSLNESWDGTWGSNPFPFTNNSVGVDGYVLVRMKLEVPSDATSGTHTTDSWYVRYRTLGE